MTQMQILKWIEELTLEKNHTIATHVSKYLQKRVSYIPMLEPIPERNHITAAYVARHLHTRVV